MSELLELEEKRSILVREERELDFLCKSEPEAKEFQERKDRLEAIEIELEEVEFKLQHIPQVFEDLQIEKNLEEIVESSSVEIIISKINPVEDRYRKAIKELERLFDFFNKKFTGNTLPTNVLITIQTRGRRRASMGWFSPEQWSADNERYSEINIAAETLSKGGPEELVDTLLHEMVHLKCYQDGIKEISKDGYHNKKFADIAESFGLNVEKSVYYGYNVTSLSDTTKQAVQLLDIDKSVFTTTRIEKPPVTDEKYENLLVRKSFKPIIKDFAELTGMSMLDLIEESITQYMKDYKD